MSPIVSHFPLRGLSSVCHIHAPCFNRSTDLRAIWQIIVGSSDTLH